MNINCIWTGLKKSRLKKFFFNQNFWLKSDFFNLNQTFKIFFVQTNNTRGRWGVKMLHDDVINDVGLKIVTEDRELRKYNRR